MLAIYGTTWRAVTQNLWFYLIAAALFVVADLFKEWLGSSHGVLIVPWSVTIYALHRSLLLGEFRTWSTAQPVRPPGLGKFLLVSMLLAGLALGPALWLFVKISFAIPSERQEEFFPVMASLSVMLFLLVYWLVLAVFGTALPAAALGDRFGLRLTLRRARRTALGIAGGLIVGPVLFVTIAFAGLVGVLLLLGPLSDAAVPRVYEVVLSFAANLLMLFNATLTVAVLCRAYRKVAPPEFAPLLIPEAGSDRGAPAQTPA